MTFDPFGGPFNGQQGRAALFQELLAEFKFSAMVETGTYFGSTTEYLALIHDAPLKSFETSSLHALLSAIRLERFSRAEVLQQDSRTALAGLVDDREFPKENVFFYLDAHWGPELPLLAELPLIMEHWRQSVVMIDDFEVPDDAGYSFDDFGSGKTLNATLLDSIVPRSTPYYPALPASRENGYRRGCVVLGTDNRASERLAPIPSLRRIS